MTKLQILLSIICSVGFGGCAGVPLPDTLLCVANAPNKVLGCYNVSKDYVYNSTLNQLQLKPGAVKTYLPLNSIDDVNKFTCTNPSGWANSVAFLNQEQGHCVCQ